MGVDEGDEESAAAASASVAPSGRARTRLALPDKAAALRFLVPLGDDMVRLGLSDFRGVDERRVLRRGGVCPASGDCGSALNLKFSMLSLPLNDDRGGVTEMLAVSFSGDAMLSGLVMFSPVMQQ